MVNYFALGVEIKELILETQSISTATYFLEVGKITSCSPVYCVSGTYLLKLCWYWFCIGHFFLWHLLLVLLHYFLHSPVQSWDCHFNIIGLIFPFKHQGDKQSEQRRFTEKFRYFPYNLFSKKDKEVFSFSFFTWEIRTTSRKQCLCYQNI